MLQSLALGRSVVTTDGADVGKLHRIVIDETTYAVSALVVERPLLTSGNLLKPGGWDMPRDQRVPIAALTGADGDAIRISPTEAEFLALPPYVIGEIPEPEPGWNPPPEFRTEDIAMQTSAALGGLYVPPQDEQENRGPTERHVSHGAAVWRRDPHTHLGDVDAVVMDDASHTATALVVRRGVIFPHDVVLPVGYIVDLLDDLVHVDIPQAELDALAPYHPET